MPVTCRQCLHVFDTANRALLDETHCPVCGEAYLNGLDTVALRSRPSVGRQIGKFEVMEEIGAGSFGTVYRARDPELDRVVAIKVPRAANLTNKHDVERFLREARSAARLCHPLIVPIHEVGEFEGMPFIVSEFVEGITLSDLLTARPLTHRETAQLIAGLAEALHYAHEHGVVHRDVEPPNILLGPDLTPHLMDFGLAKREGGVDSTVTLDGQVLGTPAYMSPEQARGDSNRVDGRSDVYSLGVILYQLLAGELPFRGNIRLLINQVQYSEPRAPRSLNDRVPNDLETICLKCLHKEPQRRYQTAKALAEDLRRWQRGEPIFARPVTRSERMWNWARRRPALASSLLLSAAVTVVGFALVSSYALSAERLRDAEEHQRTRAERALGEAAHVLYFHRTALAYRELQANNLDRAYGLLEECPEHLRDWEWHFVRRSCQLERLTLRDHVQPVTSVSYSPDGKLLASSSASPFQLNRPGDLRLWDLKTGMLVTPLIGHEGGVFCASFHPDGKQLASAGEDGTVRLWDVARHVELKQLRGHSGQVSSLQFSVDGALLTSVSGDYRTMTPIGEVIVWDAVSGLESTRFPSGDTALRAVAISPRKDWVVAAGGDSLQPGVLRIWSLVDKRELKTIRYPTGGLGEVAFSPDGRWLAVAHFDRTVRLLEPGTWKEVATLLGHSGPVTGVAFSPDSRQLASASSSNGRGEAKVWDLASLRELHCVRDGSFCVAFAPDGQTIATASGLRGIRIWDANTSREAVTFRTDGLPISCLSFAAQADAVAVGTLHGSVHVWDVATRQSLFERKGLEGIVRRVALSPDGLRVAAASGPYAAPGRIHIWDLQSGSELLTIPGGKEPIRAIAFSPDGKRIAGAVGVLVESGRPGLVKVWDAQDGREVHSLAGHLGGVTDIAFSLDGKLIFSASEDSTVRTWDARTGEASLRQELHFGLVNSLALSRDGRRIASASWDGNLRLWNLHEASRPQMLRGGVGQVSWNASGSRVAAVGPDQVVRIWDVASGQETLALRGQNGPVRATAFSPDGRYLATGAGDELKLWDGSPVR